MTCMKEKRLQLTKQVLRGTDTSGALSDVATCQTSMIRNIKSSTK